MHNQWSKLRHAPLPKGFTGFCTYETQIRSIGRGTFAVSKFILSEKQAILSRKQRSRFKFPLIGASLRLLIRGIFVVEFFCFSDMYVLRFA